MIIIIIIIIRGLLLRHGGEGEGKAEEGSRGKDPAVTRTQLRL